MSDDEYDSGPFCRHWSDPADCDEKCADCGHDCTGHAWGDGDTYCLDASCKCEEWKESDGP